LTPIEDWIDLHGFAPRDVISVVREYLEAAAQQGFDEVRLVHGRGKGVQRRSVQEELTRHPLVLSFRDAPPTRGGLGATLVWLRRVDGTGRTRFGWHGAGAPAWHELLTEALARADRVRFSAAEQGPRSLELARSFPFVRMTRAPSAERIFAAVERELGPPSSRERGRASWTMSPEARRYLLEQCVELSEWDQRRSLPEDPTLFQGEATVLAASSRDDHAVIHLDESERDRLLSRGVELVPM
jgi:hypothetical protein